MVVICYSKGEINDKSLTFMETQINEGQVDSGRMKYCIIKYFQQMQILSKEVMS